MLLIYTENSTLLNIPQDLKRKYIQDGKESIRNELLRKRSRLSDIEAPVRPVKALIYNEKYERVIYQAIYDSQLLKLTKQNPKINNPLTKKRLQSTSYIQSVKDRENLLVYSQRYKEKIEEVGLVIADNLARINKVYRKLYQNLLSTEPLIV